MPILATKRHANYVKTLPSLLCLALLLASITVQAESGTAVIVNAANTQNITRQDISNIYHDRMINWNNGEKIDVYNLPTASPAREIFSQNFLGMGAIAAAAAESNRHITNSSRNVQHLKRERLVLLSVASDKNAIGYVRNSNLKKISGIRILFVID